MGSPSVLVDKATSDLLLRPDWTMNLEICDLMNTDGGQAKEAVKAVKKRIGHRSPRVQLLALILLETMIKNCGEMVHFLVAERDILPEMVKIVKKKADMQVRDKILVLLDSWQEAFGGPGGKYPQYYWAYEELRRSGVQFPRRAADTPPIFTPPATRQSHQSQEVYGSPRNNALTLDEAMASEAEMSLSDVKAAHGVAELLAEMLRAVNPDDKQSVKDEVIVDLVEQCRTFQRRNMKLITSTLDEELLRQALLLNDELQFLLAKHDAIASGSPLPVEPNSAVPVPPEPQPESSNPPESQFSGKENEDDEDEDDFSQLAKRNLRSPMSKSDASEERSIAGDHESYMNQIVVSAPYDVTEDDAKANELQIVPVSSYSKHEEELLDLFTNSTISDISPQSPHPPAVITSNAMQAAAAPAAEEHLQDQSQKQTYNNENTHLQQPYTNNHMYQQNSQVSTLNNLNAPAVSSNPLSFQAPRYSSPYVTQQQYQYNSYNQTNFLQNNYLAQGTSWYRPSQAPIPISSPYYSSSTSASLPAPPWTMSSAEQQRVHNVAARTPALQQRRSFNLPSTPRPLQQQKSFNVSGPRSTASQRSTYVTADHLFDDLIDIKNISANMKNEANSHKMNSPKEGTR